MRTATYDPCTRLLVYDKYIPAAGTFVFSGAIMVFGIIVHLVQMVMAARAPKKEVEEVPVYPQTLNLIPETRSLIPETRDFRVSTRPET